MRLPRKRKYEIVRGSAKRRPRTTHWAAVDSCSGGHGGPARRCHRRSRWLSVCFTFGDDISIHRIFGIFAHLVRFPFEKPAAHCRRRAAGVQNQAPVRLLKAPTLREKRAMRLPCVRFTLQTLLIAIAAVAVNCWAYRARWMRWTSALPGGGRDPVCDRRPSALQSGASRDRAPRSRETRLLGAGAGLKSVVPRRRCLLFSASTSCCWALPRTGSSPTRPRAT